MRDEPIDQPSKLNGVNTTPPDYNSIYFDSNELLSNGWPDLSVKLSNLLYVGRGWGIQPFIPEAVLDETESHWWRAVEARTSSLDSAKKEIERLARPIECYVNIEQTNLEELRSRYQLYREQTLEDYGIKVVPYPDRRVEFFFQRATRYLMPFEKQGEGKGFQDAVILQSVLEHLQANPELRGVLLTKDGGMKQSRIREFLPEFDTTRLRIIALDEAWDNLFHFNFDQKVIQPWAEERKNALIAAQSLVSLWKEFLLTHLTESMLRAGGFGVSATVVKLISVDSVEVAYVDTPIPDLDKHSDRTVRISISASAQCTAIVRKERLNFFDAILGDYNKEDAAPPAPPEIGQDKATWSGGIRATAKIVNHEFVDIVPESLVSEEELRAQK